VLSPLQCTINGMNHVSPNQLHDNASFLCLKLVWYSPRTIGPCTWVHLLSLETNQANQCLTCTLPCDFGDCSPAGMLSEGALTRPAIQGRSSSTLRLNVIQTIRCLPTCHLASSHISSASSRSSLDLYPSSPATSTCYVTSLSSPAAHELAFRV
jgi:hypothetical protein